MNPFPILIRIAAGFVLATLAACGGGGGGGGGGQGALVYSGNTSQAVVTTINASKLTANVIGGDDAASIIVGVSAESGNAGQDPSSGIVDISRRLSGGFRDAAGRTKLLSSAQRAALVQIDDTQPCDGGNGTIRIFGPIDDVTGTGTVTVIFSSCFLAGVTVNGQATMRIDAFDLVFGPTDVTMSFARLTLRATGLSLDAGGSLRDQINIATNTETLTADLVQLDNNTGLMTQSANLVIISVFNNIFAPTSFTANLSGRVFDSVHGFVDITTITPAAFGTLNQLFPDSGQVLLAGTNSTALVTALNSTMVELQLDLDGVGGVDNTARLKWTELTGPVGANLGDDDGDGMHNSWETFHGLNPNVDDAAGNPDGDAFDNIAEYLAGTDPTP